jgi:general secretion pathway protein F
MPIFRYKGYKAGGAEITGSIEASSLKDAILKIKELGLYPKHIEESVEKQRAKKTDRNRLPAITRQLSVLLSSGVPLIEALRALSEESRGYYKNILIRVRERVSEGASFSRAMEEYPKIFPEFYRNMVAAGEASGTLDKVLERLSDFLEKQDATREKIKAAMIYPVFMASVGLVVLSFLFVFVVPKIVRIFEDTKNALPLITVILIWISNFFVNFWWLIIGAAIAFAGGIRYLKNKHRTLLDRVLMSLFQSLYLARFTRTLGFLLEGGLPMLRSLELAGKSTGNAYLSEKLKDAIGKVSEGARLSASLTGLPPVLLQLIATGEKSGKLTDVLKKAADSYEEDFDRKVRKALSLLEPSMILLMGVIVGFIVLAVLLPMFQLNQLIR